MDRYQRANLQTPSSSYSGSGGSTAMSVAASTMETLSSRLETFSKSFYQQAGQEAQAEAIKDATLDIAVRKEKVDTILSSDEDPENKRQKIESILEGKRKADATIYGRAYNDAASAAYSNQVTVDAKAAADLATVQAKGDPSAFYAMYNSFEKETVNNAPSTEMAITAKRSFLQYGSAAYKSISIEAFKKQDALEKETYDKVAQQLRDDYIVAVKNNDLVAQEEVKSKYAAASVRAIDKGWSTPELVQVELQQVHKQAMTETTLTEFRNTTNKVSFLQKFRGNTVFSQEETEKLVDRMHKIQQNEVDDYKIQIDKEETFARQVKIQGQKALRIKIVNGTATDKDLEDAFIAGVLSSSEYDDMEERKRTPGVSKTDKQVVANVTKDIDIISYDEIWDLKTVSPEDKMKLVKEKQSREKASEAELKEQGKWTSTQTGQQARRELKNHFGMFEGTLISQIDINGNLQKDFVALDSLLFDRVESLPVEQRASQSLALSRQLLQEYNEGKITGTSKYGKPVVKEEKKETKDIEVVDAMKKHVDKNSSNSLLNFIGKIL